MSNFVSLLAAGGNTKATSDGPKFPDAARRGETTKAFSAELDRASHAPLGRQDSLTRLRNNRADRNDAVRESSGRNELRERGREKIKSKNRDEETSLAGACAVNGQPVRLEETRQAITKPNGDCADERIAAVSEEAAGDDAVTVRADSFEGETTVVPPGELEALLEPLAPGAELLQSVEPTDATAEAVALQQADLEAVTGLLEQSSGKVTSAIAAALGTDPTATATDANVSDELPTGDGAEAALAAAPPSDEARRVARAMRRSLAEARENADGTGAAKISETMKTAIKKEEVAGLSQQLLPGSSPMSAAALSNLPGETRLGAPAGLSSVEALNAAAKSSLAPTRSDLSEAGESLNLRPTTTIARISEVVTREVRLFKRNGDDSVEVVLTPDSRTQISLRLQWREGQVEVQARCDFGDHQMLNQQWSQLQTSMAQQGVRLSHLSERAPTGFSEFFNHPNFSQQHGGDRRSFAGANELDSRAALLPQPTRSGALKAGMRSSRLLESWA